MSTSETTVNRVSPGLFLAIFLFFLSLYLATYSGRIESGDSLRVLDAASSVVHFGDGGLDESLWDTPQRFFPLDDSSPYAVYNRFQWRMPYIAAIPYAIGTVIPNLGQVHATWLLNVVLMAASCSLMYTLAVLMDYEQRVAIIGAMTFGMGTLVWAYSKTLFRDPVILFFLLSILVVLELWRKQRLNILWLISAIGLFLITETTKSSSIIAVPALIIWAMPNIKLPKRLNIILDGLLVLSLIAGILVFTLQPVLRFISSIPISIYSVNVETVPIAVHSYLLSIGGSIWATSPVLILGIVGVFQLWRQEKRRVIWSVFALVFSYAAGHALLTDIHWFGGLSLPPRFMLPTIPLLMLWVLPVIDWGLKHTNRLWLMLIACVALFSVIIQVIFAVSLVDAYVQLLPPEANGLVEWVPGLNQPQYLRWLLLPQSWNTLGWDIAWMRINSAWIAQGFLVLACVAGVSIAIQKHRWKIRLLALIGFTIWSGVGFSRLYDEDTLYWAQTPELFDVLSILEREATDAEPLFLAGTADVTYERFILNYNKSSDFRPLVLGFQPGERTSSVDTTALTTPYLRDRLDVTMMRYMDQIAQTHDRFWWLAHNSEFTEWALRPEEEYFLNNYYLLSEYETGNPTVRLLEFSSIQAPDRYDFRLPDYLTNFRFGEHITLAGYSLPAGTRYTVGDVVPLTFYWQTDIPLEVDYTIAPFLVNPGLIVLEGIQSPSDNGFTPTQSWQVNQFVPDNRAILLPDDAPTGTYQIWVRLYVTGSGGNDSLSVSGGETTEETIAILPITLEVSVD